MLGIQEKTARNHIEHIYAKCDVSTRSDATRFAIAHGLVEPLATSARHGGG
jgi:DNA-binding CsgD family transcriptional regulator